MRAPRLSPCHRLSLTLVLVAILLAAPAALGQAVETHLGFGRVFGIGWNHDGSRYAVSHARFVEIIDPATDETVLRLPRHEDRAHGVAFSPTGDRIATCTWYGTVLLTIRGWQWTKSVRFSSDGERLLVGGERRQGNDGASAGRTRAYLRARRDENARWGLTPFGVRPHCASARGAAIPNVFALSPRAPVPFFAFFAPWRPGVGPLRLSFPSRARPLAAA